MSVKIMNFQTSPLLFYALNETFEKTEMNEKL